MIDKPHITATAPQTAIIRLTTPGEEMRNVFGPGISELMDTIAAQGLAPSEPVFAHNLKIPRQL